MPGLIRNVIDAACARRTARRRARNLGAHFESPPPLRSIAVAGVVVVIAGAMLIASHARSLALAVTGAAPAGPHLGPHLALQFQAALPAGAVFSVPDQAAITLAELDGGGALLVAAGVERAPPVKIDLCRQMQGRRLLPVRIGYGFDDVAKWVARSTAAPRNMVLNGPQTRAMPRVWIGDDVAGDVAFAGEAAFAAAPLQLRWYSRDPAVRWIGDGAGGKVEQGAHGQVALWRDGWLVWRPGAALHFQRRASAGCPQAGELVVQLVQLEQLVHSMPGGGAASAPIFDHPNQPLQYKAQVTVYPASGEPVSAWLGAGRYQVPAGVRAGAPTDAGRGLEDEALFLELRRRGMLRLGAGGLAELAPRDLPAWRATSAPGRASQLAGWDQVTLDAGAITLLKRLYRMADGAYVRQQVRVFNGEQRLLAWRTPQPQQGQQSWQGQQQQWQASVGAAAASTSAAMPAAAARLFAAVGQGWAPWTRIDAWPAAAAGAAAPTHLELALAQPARGGETVQLMLIGRVHAVQGARLVRAQDACSGRACAFGGAAQVLTFDMLPGARSVSFDASALDMSVLAMPGERQYRHLHVAQGRLEWQPLALAAPAPATGIKEIMGGGIVSNVTLEDRNGVPLWGAGAPTQAAIDAGLAPLLGIRADHANSVAGMLARLPSPAGAPHAARLTLDLALQALSQRVLDCIGMRRGAWDGKACSGGQTPPSGRHAGIVIVDLESGDVLAAAGAGGAAINAANWNEVRNFDRLDPARSPLRLPAFQHDGGANSSPGSTFKVISALGLEQAALGNARIDALLAGMPLAAINRMAREQGFAFRTDASSYPAATSLAHITNYKEQHLEQRTDAGRLGLAQALTYSLNTWFAWSGELSDSTLFGRADGGAPDLQALEPDVLDSVRPIVGMAHRLGFGRPLRLDGGLLPLDYHWAAWDALQASASTIDPIHSRHEVRQMSIGLRMQVTPLQMALAAGAIGQGRVVAPRLLLSLDARPAAVAATAPVGVRLDRIRAGMKGVIDVGTATGAFRGARYDALRRGLSGKTGTAPTAARFTSSGAGTGGLATVWFTGWLEPGSLPGQAHRLALAAFVSHSDSTGGEHAAPIVAALLASNPEQIQQQIQQPSQQQKGK